MHGPSYSREAAADALARSRTWGEALERLGLSYHGRNITNLRRRATDWGLSTSHLPAARPNRGARGYSEKDARQAIAASRSWAEALRRLGYCHTGANPRMLKKRALEWGISTEHFDPYAVLRGPRPKIPLEEILVTGSTYSRSNLKRRLYDEGLKKPQCELCGQGETWRGRRMGLILDHINGVRNDNRLENLRIVCPNCAATLDTHCGKKLAADPVERECRHCGGTFRPRYRRHRYCSIACWHRVQKQFGPQLIGIPNPKLRRVERPPFEQLVAEITELGYLAVGRRYGVSDNAVRKWVRQYERERALAEGRDPEVVEIPRRTWPNRRERKAA